MNVRTSSKVHIIVDEYCYVVMLTPLVCYRHPRLMERLMYYRAWFSYVFTYLGTHMSSIVCRELKNSKEIETFYVIKPLWKKEMREGHDFEQRNMDTMKVVVLF